MWWDLPRAAARLSTSVAAVLTDGRYVTAWPIAAVILPVAALVAGLVVGAEDGAIYGVSITAVAILAGIAGFGATFGLWAWLGFVAGDLIIRDPARARLWSAPARGFAHLYGPLLVSYVLLAGLLVLAPLVANGLRVRATSFLRNRGDTRIRARPAFAQLGGVLLQIAAQGLYAVAWVGSTQAFIRPFFGYTGRAAQARAPIPPSVHDLRAHVAVIAGVTVAAAATAAVLRLGADRRDDLSRRRTSSASTEHRSLPLWLRLPLQTVVVSLLLFGLVSSKHYARLLVCVMFLILCFRAFVFPDIQAISGTVGRLALWVRLALIATLSFGIGALILAPAWRDPSASPIVVTIVWSLLLTGLLLSPEIRQRARGGRVSSGSSGSRAAAPTDGQKAQVIVGSIRRAVARRIRRAQTAATAVLATALVAMMTLSTALADSVPWWKRKTITGGATSGTFTWTGSTSGRMSGPYFGCDRVTGDATGGYIEVDLKSTPELPPASDGTPQYLSIHIYGLTSPGSYPFGNLGTWHPGSSGQADVFVNNYHSTTQPAEAGPSAQGSVTVSPDGSGSISGTLLGASTGYQGGRSHEATIDVSGSWQACQLASSTPGTTSPGAQPNPSPQPSGPSTTDTGPTTTPQAPAGPSTTPQPPGATPSNTSPPAFIPTTPANEVQSQAAHDSDPGVLGTILVVLPFFPELAGLLRAGEEAGGLEGAAGRSAAPGDAVGDDPPGQAASSTPLPADPPSPGTVQYNVDWARDDPRVGGLMQGYKPYGDLTPDQFNNKWWDANAGGGKGAWRWPEHQFPDGAVPGTERPAILQPGDVIDRFGGRGGTYLSPDGTPYADRALPPTSVGPPESGFGYHQYRVLKPLPVNESRIAPAFDQPGGGIQYEALGQGPDAGPTTIDWLIKNKFLEEIPYPAFP